MAAPLFGTDGIRAVANRGPLAPARLVRLGQGLGGWLLERRGPAARALVIRDPRRSGGMIEGALGAGLASRGVAVASAGILPTPACEVVVPALGYDLGIVLSASHNPARDNGVKLYGHDGRKLPDDVQAELEARLAGRARGRTPTGRGIGTIAAEPRARELYLADLVAAGAAAGAALAGMRIAIDCAFGATAATAPEVFRRLGADLIPLAAEPHGDKINRGVGALHPARLARIVRAKRAVVGFAFDGDGDRLICVDETGTVRDGDAVCFVLARDRRGAKSLPGRAVVGTVMSNLGLERGLARYGIGFERTPVGDRHVEARLRERGLGLGAEPSGHVLQLVDGRLRGDATLTALELCGAMIRRGRRLSELCAKYRPTPQIHTVVRVRERPPLEDVPAVKTALDAARAAVGPTGRVVARYSGTEPVARIMLEGDEREVLEAHVGRIAFAIREALGDRQAPGSGPT